MIKGIHDRPSLFYLNHKKATRSTSLNNKKKKMKSKTTVLPLLSRKLKTFEMFKNVTGKFKYLTLHLVSNMFAHDRTLTSSELKIFITRSLHFPEIN